MSDPQTIVLGGGCFWCTEAVYKEVQGITDVESGYSNGHAQRPSYEQVCTGTTGHNEVVKLTYDPAQISTRQILEIFFVVHDPTQLNRQGPDRGDQYRSAVYYLDDAQKATTEKLIQILKDKGLNVVTVVTKATKFYPAEKYHQQYYEKKGSQPYCHAYTKRF